jgi:hypothetical protein
LKPVEIVLVKLIVRDSIHATGTTVIELTIYSALSFSIECANAKDGNLSVW